MTFLSNPQEELDQVLEARGQSITVADPPEDSNGTDIVPARTSVLARSYNPNQYVDEKREGIRLINGVKPLKKLTQRHFKIINLWIEGNSPSQCASAIGCTIQTIWKVVNDSLAAPYIERAYKARQSEIDAMLGKNIAAVRDVLDKGTDKDKLSAVGAYTKLKTTVAAETNPEESAEDLATKIVKQAIAAGVIAGDVNIQINQGVNGNGSS